MFHAHSLLGIWKKYIIQPRIDQLKKKNSAGAPLPRQFFLQIVEILKFSKNPSNMRKKFGKILKYTLAHQLFYVKISKFLNLPLWRYGFLDFDYTQSYYSGLYKLLKFSNPLKPSKYKKKFEKIRTYTYTRLLTIICENFEIFEPPPLKV